MRRPSPSLFTRLFFEAVTLLILAAGLHQLVWWMGAGIYALR